MKIGIDVTASIYTGTGVATYYQSLVPRLVSQGKEHSFVLLGYALRLFPRLTLANRKFPFPPRLMEFVWNRLHIVPVELLTGSIDVFHAWDYLQPPTKNAKVVTTIHDLTTVKFPLYHHPSTVEAQSHRLRWIRREADAVIADSSATKMDIQEYLGIEEGKISVVPLAAGEWFTTFEKKNEELKERAVDLVRKKYGIEGEYLLSIGTIEPRKNIKRVVEAFSRIRLMKHFPQTLIVAGGIGWGEQTPQAQGVKPIGLVPPMELPPLCAGAQALVYPSLYEGFGLPVLEAMTVGCPVVTTDRGSLSEVSADAAVLVDPEDVESISLGIESALEKRVSLVARGRARAQQYSWEKTASQTLAVYQSIVNQSTGA